MVEVGVNHYPRLEGEQSGASVKVMLRAVGETFKLWGRMRDYVPPSGEIVVAPASARGMILFIGAVNLGAIAGLAVLGYLVSRLRRKRS